MKNLIVNISGALGLFFIVLWVQFYSIDFIASKMTDRVIETLEDKCVRDKSLVIVDALPDEAEFDSFG